MYLEVTLSISPDIIAKASIHGMIPLIEGEFATIKSDLKRLKTMSKMILFPERISCCKSENDRGLYKTVVQNKFMRKVLGF